MFVFTRYSHANTDSIAEPVCDTRYSHTPVSQKATYLHIFICMYMHAAVLAAVYIYSCFTAAAMRYSHAPVLPPRFDSALILLRTNRKCLVCNRKRYCREHGMSLPKSFAMKAFPAFTRFVNSLALSFTLSLSRTSRARLLLFARTRSMHTSC